jgi:hypothetical protein
MSNLRFSASILLVLALVAIPATAANSQAMESKRLPGVDGKVSSAETPLRAASVYAYQLADLSLEKVVTDADGEFTFASLPVGLYKIIAFKPGFAPAVVMLSRLVADARQFIDLELLPQTEGLASEGGFWELREKIPSDVLRDMQIAQAEEEFRAVSYASLADANFSAQMRATTGVHEGLDYGEATVAGGQLDIEGRFRDYLVGVTGNFSKLEPQAFGEDSSIGSTQQVALDLVNPNRSTVSMSSLSNSLTTEGNANTAVDFQHHMLSWSRPVGREARSEITAQYTEESNFYSQGPIETPGLPESSRTLRVEGSYTTPVNQRTTIQAGFRYRDLQSEYNSLPLDSLSLLPQETVELFSRGGVQVKPAVVVEYGLYSTLRDGSLSLVPQGGLVVNLNENWRASGLVSHRIDQENDYRPNDFVPAFFNESGACDQGAEYCYKVMLSRLWEGDQNMSLGAVHRKYADTMRMYFDRDFYDRLESLFFVPGDSLPELQFELTRRLSPEILTRLESNVASGGGGVLVSGDQTSYENSVSYMVTSLDTHFEETATGVFVAFHHLQQDLEPLQGQTAPLVVQQAPSFSFGGYVGHPLAVALSGANAGSSRAFESQEVELQRLQLMLSQDLSFFHSLAKDWAVHVNMEVSRGSTPDSALYDADDLRKRLTGGIAVKF